MGRINSGRHAAHSAACGCRRIEGGVKSMLTRHGYREEGGKVCASN